MADFDKMLRPFAPVGVAPRQGLTSIPAVVPDVVVLVKAGEPKIMHYSYSNSFNSYMEKQVIEQADA